jgi:hypothetical protein
MLRVPPPEDHVRLLTSVVKVLDQQVHASVLIEATHRSSNQGEYADIAHELGREFLMVRVVWGADFL